MRTLSSVGAVLGVALAGGSSTSSGSAATGGSCASSAGVYRVHYVLESGNGSNVPDQLVDTTATDASASGCVASLTQTADGCSSHGTETCTDASGGTRALTLAFKSTEGGEHYTGTISVRSNDSSGAIACVPHPSTSSCSASRSTAGSVRVSAISLVGSSRGAVLLAVSFMAVPCLG